MADLRQRAPELRPTLINENEYRRVQADTGLLGVVGQGIDAAARGLTNVFFARENQQRQQAADNQDYADDLVAGMEAERILSFAESEIERIEGAPLFSEEELETMTRAERTARMLDFMEGQGNRRVGAKLRRLADVASYMTAYPQMAGELNKALTNTSNTNIGELADEVIATSQTRQDAIGATALDLYKNESVKYGYLPGDDPAAVFATSAAMSRLEADAQRAKSTLEVIQSNEGVDSATYQRAYRQLRPVINSSVNSMLYGAMTNIMRRFPDVQQVERGEAEAATAEIGMMFDDTLNTLAAAYNMTPAEFEADYPQVGRIRQAIQDWMDPTKEKEHVQATLDLLKLNVERSFLEGNPGLNETLVFTGMIDDVTQGPLMGTLIDLELGEAVVPMYKGFGEILRNGLIPQIEAARTGQALDNTDPNALQSLPRGGRVQPTDEQVSNLRSGLDLIGVTLSPDAPIGNTGQNAIAAMDAIARDMGTQPDRIPIKYYKEIVRFLADPQGFKAFTNYAQVHNPEAASQFVIGLEQYLTDQAANARRDLTNGIAVDTIPDPTDTFRPERREVDVDAVDYMRYFLSFTAIDPIGFYQRATGTGGTGEAAERVRDNRAAAMEVYGGERTRTAPVYSLVDLNISPEGTARFSAKPNYASNPRVQKEVEKLNRKFAGVISDETRAYTNMFRRDGDYQQGFRDLMQAGSFATPDNSDLVERVIAELEADGEVVDRAAVEEFVRAQNP